MSILEIKNLYKHFDGIKAVDHLSLSFETGKITGLIGPNGSGKSTLINLLTGVIPFDSGRILISETTKLLKIEPFDIASYGITRTFQDVRLFEQMSVIDNILVVLTERSVWSSVFETHREYHLEKTKEALDKVGLWEKRDELAINLSYGQRKLLEIARALSMNADIYFSMNHLLDYSPR
jgi:branched-chain amino acid transport system ATP-binding protein